MPAITKIADIPFRKKEILELLDLVERDYIGPSYDGYGHGDAHAIRLEGLSRGRTLEVKHALVIAVHSSDDGAPLSDDIELEFVIADTANELSVTTTLSKFMGVWLPIVYRPYRSIVLAVCNPHNARIRAHPCARETTLYYPLGAVRSWIVRDDGGAVIALTAEDDWHIAMP